MGGFNLSSWLAVHGTPFESLPLLLTSLGIGLLIGVERERKRHVLAGIRTIPLIALLGTLCTLIARSAGAPYMPLGGLLAVVALGFLPNGNSESGDSQSDPRTTTLVAALVAYALGVLTAYGYSELAVAGAILTTSLLYLKPELSGLSNRLERRDLYSLLQFAALSLIVLPVLPNRSFGPYLAFNPHQIWLMVVLVAGIGLSGYLLEKIIGERVNGPLLGLLGGLVSSTATSLVYSREASANPASIPFASQVIRVANLVLLLRLTLLALVVAPAALPKVALAMLPALAIGLVPMVVARNNNKEQRPELALGNPTELKLALGFGVIFAAVLFCSAWLGTEFGNKGVYAVAVISGVNEVDAITLSAMNLFNQHRMDINGLVATLALAVGSNTLFKFGLIATIGGRDLALRCLPTFATTLIGLAGSYVALLSL
ncbi:MgtC/SapB family protein [Paludibacterium yongneupense]|uniref:MgtC/SapB family protein n=1 Tax=Paludibacterium yongneupense TaxID=400061 RepID=UPI000406931F|nr:DUF4010 domain-containing protein [Paludibacterium yongneupense]